MSGANYVVPDSATMFLGSFSATHCSAPAQHCNGFLGPPLKDLALQPQYSLSSKNSTFVIDERKQRRMISNRESARRSRMRKQRHLDELWRHVMRFRNENRNLIEKLNSMYESIDKMVQENAKLIEETSDLRLMLRTLQIGSPYNGLQDSDEVPCNRNTPVSEPHLLCYPW
uniref:BZIP domain-containing protein n=1 Tax=Kalanchoe fedtschenkoi TaxID=63787 RepID=A0A7N0UDB5_KALFE